MKNRPFPSILGFSLFLILVAGTNQAKANLCQEWSAAKVIGELDKERLPEASGLAISSDHSGRFYHLNDRGNDTEIIVTSGTGKNLGEIGIKDFETEDTEDLALGRCGDRTCLFIADIGDNKETRDQIQIGLLEEKAIFAKKEPLLRKKTLVYPDGPHNAEAIFVDNTGDLFIFTKGSAKKISKKVKPSYIYKATSSELMSKEDQPIELQLIGQIDTPKILRSEKPRDQLVTGAAINSQNNKVVLLTYKNLIEIDWQDFRLNRELEFQVTELRELPQQEAVSFLPLTNDIVVTSEFIEDSEEDSDSLVSLQCIE